MLSAHMHDKDGEYLELSISILPASVIFIFHIATSSSHGTSPIDWLQQTLVHHKVVRLEAKPIRLKITCLLSLRMNFTRKKKKLLSKLRLSPPPSGEFSINDLLRMRWVISQFSLYCTSCYRSCLLMIPILIKTVAKTSSCTLDQLHSKHGGHSSVNL